MVLKEFFIKIGIVLDDGAVKKLDGTLTSIKRGFFAVGAATLAAGAAVSALVVELANKSAAIRKAAQSAGVTTTALQELGFAAKDTEGLTTALVKLSRTIYSASEGSKEAAKVFSHLGVKIKNSDGTIRSADAVLMDVAEHFKKMPDGVEKTALSMQLFGRSGATLIPFLNKGKEGIGALRQEAHDLGIVLDEDTIKKGKEVKDSLFELNAAWEGIRYTIGGPLLKDAAELIKQFSKWSAKNRELIKSRVHIAINFLRLAFRAVWFVISTLNTVLSLLITNWRILAVVLVSVVATALYLNAGGALWLAHGLALVSIEAVKAAFATARAWLAASAPFILMAAAITLVILVLQDLFVWASGGDSLIGSLIARFKEWLDTITEPNPNDPWWLVALKDALRIAKELGDIIDRVAGSAGRFVTDVAGSDPRAVAAIQPVLELTRKMVSAKDGGNKPFGGGASPGASAVVSGVAPGVKGKPVISPQFNAKFEFNGTNDPEKAAKEVKEKMKDFFDTEMRKLAETF